MDAAAKRNTAFRKTPRRGFTLVEILIVIVIIGMLMALILPAINAARTKAKEAVIKTDLSNLGMAVQNYKTDRASDYPPDFFGVHGNFPPEIRDPARAAVMRHLRKVFPRYVVTPMPGNNPPEWDSFRFYIRGAYTLDIENLTPASAMVFWLGGLPDQNTKQLQGFSANPRRPFAPGGARMEKLFDFDETRLQGFNTAALRWDHWPTYSPAKTEVPYVYFKARTLSGRREYAVLDANAALQQLFYIHPVPATNPYTGPTGNAANYTNVCVAYLAEASVPADPGNLATIRRWNNADTFQIICAGLDEEFGDQPATSATATDYRFSESGLNFSNNDGDYDNLTNFSQGRLEDGIEE